MTEDQKKQQAAEFLQSVLHPKPAAVMKFTESADDILEKSGYQAADPASPLQFAIDQATGKSSRKAPALAFTENPAPSDNYLGLYKSKRRLLPDEVIKQIRVTDHLVASILRARGNMMSMFGHLRKDRFDIGVEVKVKPEFYKILTPEQHQKVAERIKAFEKILLNCGHTEGLEQHEKMTLAEFMDIQARNGMSFARYATEIIADRSEQNADGTYKFHRFRPVDVATIVRAVRKGKEAGDNLRAIAIAALESIKGEKLNINIQNLKEDKYAWLQVIDGVPRQAFTHDEMIVFDLFPSTDIEHNGYPVSPLDTVVSSVTTHISIDTYKKLYFQNGRASKGMLVIKSDEVDEQVLNTVQLQFNAAINSVSNSFRTPIFGIAKEDDVQWLPFSGEGAHDDDFAFMYDGVARAILSAFGVSPDELPGYSHLSRGTNSQTLSESSNEFKLTAARDTGLRPLILKFQIFFNQRLFPLIDPLLAKICEIRFSGIDAASKEQESTRLQQDSALHMTYDDVLREVDKDSVGAYLAGKVPFSERYQLILDKYLEVGKIRSAFMDDPAAAIDPLLKFTRDPFALQNMQLLAQTNPAALNAFFAPKPFALDFLKMNIQDSLDEDEENA